MIRIDSVNQPLPTKGGPIRADNDKPSSSFAALLAEQTVKIVEASKSEQERYTAFDNQLTGPKDSYAANLRGELQRLLSMSPAELIRYQVLEKEGLTEESLKGLPIEERTIIEDMIKDEIDRQLAGTSDAGEKTLRNMRIG